MFSPGKDWYWYLDQNSQRLAISLGEEYLFLTEVAAKKSNLNSTRQDFSMVDCQLYYQVMQHGATLTDNSAQVVQWALNAVAGAHYQRLPMLMNSGLRPAPQVLVQYSIGQVAYVLNQDGQLCPLIICALLDETAVCLALCDITSGGLKPWGYQQTRRISCALLSQPQQLTAVKRA